jgi:hypothetical protein
VTVVDAQLSQDVVHVAVDRGFGDDELLRDLQVRQVGSYELEHFLFARREGFHPRLRHDAPPPNRRDLPRMRGHPGAGATGVARFARQSRNTIAANWDKYTAGVNARC